ncbi:membrane protein [Burkholderia gladioli]|uniref:OmpA family protein n=1 Tax=Burkholderia gladioli TaxID=28095 RepID=UPI00050F7E1F|nr:OmpA family protein [Burkholderia gladioli]AYQ91792.1 outer membrane protein assembly factor BamE [Burkholderia gladioli]KGE10183.1 membrane protein [Burkholderia gladioli]
MNIRTIAAVVASLLTAAVLQGCASPKAPPQFPNPQSASPSGGTFVNLDNLRNMSAGLDKDQVYDLIGPPHFNEWFVGNRVWNYLFDFRRGSEVVACQYQVQFDRHGKVSGTYWRESACADRLRTAAPAAPVAVEPKLVTIEQFSLESDALFAFGKSDIDSMLPGGKAELDRDIARIKRHRAVSGIEIVGHTDRIGSAEFNQSLSLARANTVRDYMVAHGLAQTSIHTSGVGSSESITTCPSGESRAVIACLQPDRRVAVTVKGQRDD